MKVMILLILFGILKKRQMFGIAFFLIGIALFGIGLLGEYVGRIYQEVRNRPRYMVLAVLEQTERSNG